MEQSRFGKYTIRLIIILIIMVSLLVGFNWLVNPLNVYAAPVIKGFNAIKVDSEHESLVKTSTVARIKPELICLGTSRTEFGIDPSYQGWPSQPVYNMAVRSANIAEMAEYFEYAHSMRPLKQVALFLDFCSFEEIKQKANISNPSHVTSVYDTMEILLSMHALQSSIKCIISQDDSHRNSFYDNGFMDEEYTDCIGVSESYHASFLRHEKSYVIYTYLPERYDFVNQGPDWAPFEYYRKILNIAYRDNIDLRIGISPCHARQWETLAVTGLWPEFEEWKRLLVNINEEEAELSGQAPFPLWDCSLYNEYTTEDLPPLDDTNTDMDWFWDSSHYKKELGNLVIDCIFSQYTGESNLGVLLTSENIEEHLQTIRTDREDYRQAHPDDIAEIEALVKGIN